MSIIIGLDPGLTGAIAWIDQRPGALTAVGVTDMPLKPRGKTGRSTVDARRLAALMPAKHQGPRVAYLEHVWAQPDMGAQGAFGYGEGFGIILGVLAALQINTILVRPNHWKKAMGLKADKEKSRKLAIKLYPQLADKLARKMDHNRAEALLLCHFGCEQLERDRIVVDEKSKAM